MFRIIIDRKSLKSMKNICEILKELEKNFFEVIKFNMKIRSKYIVTNNVDLKY